MKLDKLPVGEAVIGFLMAALAVTFIGAFIAVDTGNGAAGGDGGTPTPSPAATNGTPLPGGNEIVMHDNKFDPTTFTVAVGATTKFSIKNEGIAIHNVRFAGADGKFNSSDDAVSDPDLVRGGQTATLEWTAPSAPGDYSFQCDFHPTEMKGTITVQ